MKKPPMKRSIFLWALPAILTVGQLYAQTDPVPVGFNARPLYNGSITSMQWRITQPHGTAGGDFEGVYLFDYDEKYQLKEAVWGQRDITGRVTTPTNTFRLTGLEYDANGNISFLRRYGETGGLKNDFTYSYKVNTNQLSNITGHSTYHYNKIGQLNQEQTATGQNKYVQYDVTGKVTAVYSDGVYNEITGEVTYNVDSLKVEYKYDDRGFRLTSKNHETGITTWYIRDASGNVMSIYEEKEGGTDLIQKEVPLYGSGKIGTYYADQDGSVAYELTDHLGNVRAVMSRRNVTFTATMEDTGVAGLENPRVEEMQYFLNLAATELPNAGALNHTPGGSYAAYLDGSPTRTIGPAITLQVKAGDKVSMKAFGKYEDQASYSTPLAIADLANALTGTYLGLNGQENALQLTDIFTSSLTGFANDGATTTRPLAFLNFIYFDNNFSVLNAQKIQIDATAAFSPGQEAMVDFDKLENAVDIPLPGYIYVYLSNHTPASRVWFDDLTVTLTEDMVTQATDYYPFGSVMRRVNTPNSYFEGPGRDEKQNFGQYYRYGFQGQFSEEDSETNWNSFELRMYNPVIGRFTTIDPEGQFWSPYMGIGNDPINGLDPTGGVFYGPGPGGPGKGLLLKTRLFGNSFVNKDGSLSSVASESLSNPLKQPITAIGNLAGVVLEKSWNFTQDLMNSDPSGIVGIGGPLQYSSKAARGADLLRKSISTEPGMQDMRKVANFSEIISNMNSADDFLKTFGSAIEVIEADGKLFIHDGHHRVLGAIDAAADFDIPIQKITLEESRFNSLDELYDAANNADF